MINDKESIRPYLNAEQLKHLDQLQKHDAEIILLEQDYQKRKQHMEWYGFVKLGISHSLRVEG